MVASTQMPPGGIYTDARRWHLPRCHFCGSGGISPDDKVASPQMPKQTLNRRLASTRVRFLCFSAVDFRPKTRLPIPPQPITAPQPISDSQKPMTEATRQRTPPSLH